MSKALAEHAKDLITFSLDDEILILLAQVSMGSKLVSKQLSSKLLEKG